MKQSLYSAAGYREQHIRRFDGSVRQSGRHACSPSRSGFRNGRVLAIAGISLASSLFLTACDTGQLPIGAVMDMLPSERRFEVSVLTDASGRCVFDASSYLDVPVVVSLHDAQGSPMTHAELVIYADYAANSYPGLEVLALYDDTNGNGVIDPDSEWVSGADDGVFTTRTGQYSGDRNLWLRINLSCPFAGEVRAIAGDLSKRMRVEVVAGSTLSTTLIGQPRE